MTLETNECNAVREGSKAEFEGKGVLDSVAQEDGKRSGECNGIACPEADEVNEVAKDDVDSSYVFVSGESDELSERDLDVDVKVDLAGNQIVESRVETDELLNRDLGADSRVENLISEIDGKTVENAALMPSRGAEVGERSSGSNESSDQNIEKGGLVVSNGELNHEKGEIGRLILENGDNYKATDTLNSDSEVGKQNIGEEAPVRDVIVGHLVPEPVTEVQNEVSCVAQGCGESFTEIDCNHDGFNREITVNCDVEGQFDGGSKVATTSEIKESKAEATGMAGSAPPSLVNAEETVTSNAEEMVPSAEEYEAVVTVAHGSESPHLENKESLASDATEDIPASQQAEIAITERIETEPLPLMNEEKMVTLDSAEEIPSAKQSAQSDVPATEKSEIVVKVTHGSELLPHENEETLASDAAEDVPATKQADIKATERTGSESLPFMNEEEMLTRGSELLHLDNEKTLASDTADDVPAAEQTETITIENTGSESMVTSNSTQEIPAAEQSAQFRMEPESETQSKIDLREIYDENRETMPISTADNVKSKADKSDAVQENNERLPSWHVESLEGGSEASETIVEIPESSNTCHFDGNELVDEVTTFDDNANIELEVGEESAKSRGDIYASSANDMDSKTIIEEASSEGKLCPSSHVHGVEPEPEVINKSTKGRESVSACPEVETKAVESGDNASTIPDNDTKPVTEDSPLIVGVGKDEGSYDVDDVKSKSKVGSGPMECEESMTDSVEEIHSAKKNDPDRLAHAASNAAERGPKDEVLPALIDGASGLSLPGQKMGTDVKPQQFFMIRVPRFSDDKLKIKIQQAQQEVDGKTESRDFIRVAMQKQKAVCTEYWQKVEDARKEERAARDAVASKRQEIESIQSFLSKLKNATSISDIDSRIHNLQHRINHETNTLKEEKLLIREMNQLKQNRENLSASLASEAELQEAFGKREEMETRLQHLKGELDTLRKDILRAEGNTKSAKTRYDDQCEHLRNLQAQFRAADDLRQEAYTNLRNLKKESYVKNEYFYSYKDDMKVATSYAFSGDREALRCHCSSQVDKVMELWNTNDEFRHQYVKANIPSTVRRFRTLDGRSLGPDEQPAILHNPTEQKENIVAHVSKNNTPALATEREEEKVDAPLSAVKLSPSDGPTSTQKSQPQKPRKVTKPTPKEVVPDKENDKEEEEKETKKTTEEEELAKKAEELAWKEELRKEKEATELKEQLRLEQIAKAKEAEERKKRKAEKAQAKAEIRAQKEAELREKKREKKERKKERKATATNTENACEAEAPAPVTEIPPVTVQEQSEKMASVSSKKPSRSWAPPKEYNKIKPLPPPLRNRGKRKMQTWIWLLLTAVVVLALFVAGDYVSFSKFSLRSSGF